MAIRFNASQSVKLFIPEQPIPIQHYLRQPHRLVWALVDPSRVEQLNTEQFRLKMRPISFMTLGIQPTVDLEVRATANGTIHLRSLACEIRGVEYINQRFQLHLEGELAPIQKGELTYLQGKADLEVQVELPPPFLFTPKALLEATGNGLLRSVLLTIKQRLMHQLICDYLKWATTQSIVAKPDRTPALSPHTPLA